MRRSLQPFALRRRLSSTTNASTPDANCNKRPGWGVCLGVAVGVAVGVDVGVAAGVAVGVAVGVGAR